MLRLIKFLFTGDYHLHYWETENKVRLVDGSNEPIGYRMYCRCKHCGAYKVFDL